MISIFNHVCVMSIKFLWWEKYQNTDLFKQRVGNSGLMMQFYGAVRSYFGRRALPWTTKKENTHFVFFPIHISLHAVLFIHSSLTSQMSDAHIARCVDCLQLLSLCSVLSFFCSHFCLLFERKNTQKMSLNSRKLKQFWKGGQKPRSFKKNIYRLIFCRETLVVGILKNCSAIPFAWCIRAIPACSPLLCAACTARCLVRSRSGSRAWIFPGCESTKRRMLAGNAEPLSRGWNLLRPVRLHQICPIDTRQGKIPREQFERRRQHGSRISFVHL